MRRLYTVDEIQRLLFEAASASVPAWRRWRASRILGRLPESVRNQARIVAETRFHRAWAEVMRLHGWA
jgi:hypothetical protein